MGRRRGQSTPAQRAASRRNGAKGGDPRGQAATDPGLFRELMREAMDAIIARDALRKKGIDPDVDTIIDP